MITGKRFVSCNCSYRTYLKSSRIGNGNVQFGLVTGRGGVGLNGLNYLLSLDDFAEYDMLAIEMGGLDGGDEELGAIGVLSRVGHAQEVGLVVLLDEVLIGELLSVD